MKNFFLLILLLFFNFTAFSQFEIIIPHKVGVLRGGLVLETSNQDYIIVTDDISTENCATLTNTLFKVSSDGDLIGDSLYFFNLNLSGDIISLNNNEILLAGAFMEELQDKLLARPVLCKIDEELNIISIDTIPLPNYSFIHSSFPGLALKKILPTKTGGFFASAMSSLPNYNVFYKLNANFDTIKTQPFKKHSYPHNIIDNNNDSSYYFFSNFDVFNIDKDNLSATFVEELESDIDIDGLSRLTTVKYLNDNRILMYSSLNVTVNPNNPYQPAEFDTQVGVYIVDTLFNLKDYIHLSYANDTIDRTVARRNGIDFTDPNNIFVVSVINHSVFTLSGIKEEESSIMVSILDSNLNIKHQTFYGGDDRYLPCDIQATADGGCIIISSKYEINSGNNYAYIHLLKVNQYGTLTPIIPIGTEEIPTENTMKQAIIYPNPATDFFTVRYGQHLKDVKIELFNMNGQQVLDKNLTSNISKINIENLSSGTYIYHIISENKIIEKDKLIKK